MTTARCRVLAACLLACALGIFPSTGSAQVTSPTTGAALANGVEDHTPGVAFDGTSHLVVWDENGTIMAAAMTAAGAASTPISLANGRNPAVAGGAGGFLVTWAIGSGPTATISAVRVAVTGGAPAPESPFDLAIAQDADFPAVAANGTDFLVAWQQKSEASALDFDIAVGRVSPSGSPFVAVLLGDTTDEQRPSLTALGPNYLLAWEQKGLDWDIYAAVVDLVQIPLNGGTALTTAGGNQLRPAAAATASQGLVTWVDDSRAPQWDVVGRRVTDTAGLAVAQGTTIPIAAGLTVAASEPTHALTANGFDYLAAYASGGKSYGVAVSSAGAVGAPYQIAGSAVEPGLGIDFATDRYLEVHRSGAIPEVALLFVDPQPSVTVTCSGLGSVSSAPPGASCGTTLTVALGTDVQLTATPGATSTFSSWTGCPAASGETCAATVTGAVTIAASFALAAPGQPGVPTFPSRTPSSLTVDWSAASGATSYELERANDVGGTFGTWGAAVTTAAAPYLADSLSAGTTYWFRVRGVNAAGPGPWSSAASATVALALPGAPTALAFSSIGQTTVTLSWTAPASAASYVVARGANSVGPFTEVGTSTAPSFTDATVTANTTYWYVVHALNAEGAPGPDSTAARAMTLPNAPTISSVTAGASSTTITWTAPAGGATSYDVERATSSTGAFSSPGATANGVTALTFTDATVVGGTQYWYQVVARNSDGVRGAPSPALSTTTVPGAPAAPTYSNIAATTVTVSWNEVMGATSYEVSRADGASSTWTVRAAAIASPTVAYAETVLSANSSYRFRVRAQGASGFGSYSAESSVLTVPGTPTALTFPTVTSNSLTVGWTAPTGGAVNYVVQRSPNGVDSWTQVGAAVTGTSTVDSGLSASTQYWYRVTAQNATGSGTPTAAASAYTRPQAPTAPALTGATASGVTATWNAVAGATSYRVERSTDNVTWAAAATAIGSTTFTDTGASPGNSTYWYRVIAIGAGGDSAPSAASSILLLPTAPGTPTFSNLTATSLTVSWTAPPGTGTLAYELQSAPDNAGAPGAWTVVASNLAVTTANRTGLPAGSRVWYRVSASNATGTGAFSAAAAVQLLPGAPGAITLSPLDGLSLTLSWGGAPGAVSYKIERQDNGGAWLAIATAITATTYVDSALIGNTTYAYRVRATNGSGDGIYSAVSSTFLTPPSAPRVPTPQYTSITQSSLVVNWVAAPGGAVGYDVERAPDVNGVPGTFQLVHTNTAALSYQDAGLTAATRYWYRIFARNSVGSAVTPATSVATLADIPVGAPGVPTFTVITATSMQVSWTAAAGATSYQVERAPDVGGAPGAWAVVRDLMMTTYTQTGLSPNVVYWYRVRGVSTGGKGPYSAVSSVLTAPSAPGAPTFSNIADTSVTVSWAPPASGAATYKLERSVAAIGPWTSVATGIATPTFGDSGLRPNTLYYYRVRATSATGADSAYSATRSITTAPDSTVAVPGAVLALTFVPRATSIQVGWSAPTGATTYRIELAPDVSGSPGTWTVLATGVTATSYSSTGLVENTRYWYRIRGSNDGGEGPYSPSAVSMTTPRAPPPPTFSAIAATAVTLNWTAPAGSAASYRIERASSSIGPWQTVTTVTGQTYRDIGIAANTTYYYRVCGLNTLGSAGPYSSSALVTTAPDGAVTAPGASTSVSVVAVSWSSLRLTWAAVSGATSYVVERAPDVSGAAGTWSQIVANVGTTSFTSAGLTPNTAYWFRVRGVNAGGAGAASTPSRGVTFTAVPGAPTFSVVVPASLTVTWAPPSGGASGYLVERSVSSPSSWSQVGTAAAWTFTDGGLTGNTTYYYRVRGLNSAGVPGSYSPATSVTTAGDASVALPVQPAAPQLTAVAATTAKVVWQASTGATSYEVQSSTDGTAWTTVATRITTTAKTATWLIPNTQYWFRVAGQNAAGTGPYSPAVSGHTLPNTPGGVVAAALSSVSVAVAWTTPDGGADTYKVYRATSPLGPWTTVVAALRATSYDDVGLTANTFYYYRVRATNVAGADGPYSAVASTRTLLDVSAPLPAVAAAPSIAGVSPTSVSLAWPAATGAASYDVQRAPDVGGVSGAWSTVATGVTTLAYTDRAGIVGNTQYWVRIVSVNAAGAAAASDPTPALTPPAAPGAPSFSGVTSTSLTLSWSVTAGGADVYAIERAVGMGTWSEISRTAAATWSDAGLTAGLTYWYRVRGFNSAGQPGPYSSMRYVIAPP